MILSRINVMSVCAVRIRVRSGLKAEGAGGAGIPPKGGRENSLIESNTPTDRESDGLKELRLAEGARDSYRDWPGAKLCG